MPNLGIGLFIGDSEGDTQVGPVGPDGVIQSEAGAFLQVEAGQFLAFD